MDKHVKYEHAVARHKHHVNFLSQSPCFIITIDMEVILHNFIRDVDTPHVNQLIDSPNGSA